MRCDYFDAAVCGSCTLLGQSYAEQLAGKEHHARHTLRKHPDLAWLAPVTSPESGFRNKAKMVVGGTADAPTVGILDAHGRGVDLRHCGLHTPAIRAALPTLAEFITHAELQPYDVPARSGELKHVLVTESPDGELMVRFVLRSTEALTRIGKHLPWLRAQVPAIAVASVNVLPEHKAALEGEREIVLTERTTLPMRLGDVVLRLRPQGFFQTNTAVARQVYTQAAAWVDAVRPQLVWDLYSGVGGFALHCAAPGRDVVGVELSAEAVRGAEAARDDAARGETAPDCAAQTDTAPDGTVQTDTAPDGPARTDTASDGPARDEAAPDGVGMAGVRFVAADATRFALTSAPEEHPDALVVNPPRRGIGPELSAWIETSGIDHVVYSSCNAESLARDLRAMPSLVAREARLLDMFPQTAHYEVVVRLERRPRARASTPGRGGTT